MKSVIIEAPKEPAKAEYPCLKIAKANSGYVYLVMFVASSIGTVLYTDNPNHCPRECNWDESTFKPFTDKLELSN